jgi:HK97 family phage major capsid protein
MATSRELREKRAKIIEQMKQAVAKGDELRAKGEAATDYDAAFDKAEAEERELSKQIERQERIEALEKEAAGNHLEDLEKRGEGIGDRAKKLEYRDAFRQWFKDPAGLTQEMRSLLAEKRGTNTQVAGTTTLGGYTIDTELFNQIDVALKDYSGIFQAARIVRTSGGNTLYMATEDDTSTVAGLIAEAASITVQDLTYGQKQLDAYKYATQMKLSWELMQDSSFDMDLEVRNAFGPRFGRALNASGTTGTGSSQPNGVVTASSLGKTAASATAFTFSELIDLVHSVDPAYRMSQQCGFMFNDAILAAIKKLSIGTGDARPLWQPSVREGEPDRIEGYRYWINQSMDSTIDADSKIVLFGDFSKFVIRMVQELVTLRLNERYADNGLVGYIGYMRWDTECLNTAAIKHLITASS